MCPTTPHGSNTATNLSSAIRNVLFQLVVAGSRRVSVRVRVRVRVRVSAGRACAICRTARRSSARSFALEAQIPTHSPATSALLNGELFDVEDTYLIIGSKEPRATAVVKVRMLTFGLSLIHI